jgi:putative nucleotidyltransferase with HDIG domain
VEIELTEFERKLDSLLQSGKQLPTLPILVMQVQKAVNNEMSGLRDIGLIIERDPALTSRVLRVANSALYTRGDAVTTIGAAVARLGMAQVRSLCLTVGVVRAFGDTQRRLDHKRYWQHSAAVGMVAERLADESKRYASVDGGEAYVAGLLHDVGLLIADQFFPAEFAGVQEEMAAEETARWRVETRRLGLDHGGIARLVLRHWQLPPQVISAVAAHHQPENCAVGAEGLSRMVWAAEALCAASGLDLPQEGIAEVAPEEVLAELDIDAEVRQRILDDVGQMGEKARHFTH